MKDFKINIYKNIPILVLAMSLLIISSAQAGFNPIKCETNFGEKTFIIEESNIAFFKKSNKGGREISSNLESRVRNMNRGIERIMYIGMNKYRIHIENLKDFKIEDDYLSISNPQGHEMTYPIKCSFNQ